MKQINQSAVPVGKPEWQVCKCSHCGKQQ